MTARTFKCVVTVIAALVSTITLADKPVPESRSHVVGHKAELSFRPDLTRSTRDDGRFVWTRHVFLPGASFIKLNLVDVNLRKGDTLTITNPKGRVIETITGRGPKNMGNFWALSVPGDRATLTFDYANAYKQAPFEVADAIAGNTDLFAKPAQEETRSICSPADFQDAICYQADTGVWANVQASVGVMAVGGFPNTALFCSGSNVSPFNYVLTNNNCIANQAECDNAEYVFSYYNQICGSGPPTPNWVSYRCDTVVAFEPFVDCDAGPGSLDFTLTSVIGDPASTFGYVEVDPTPLVSGENVYIVQHAAGRPQEITEGDGSNFEVDGTVLRYYGTLDTEAGSTGAPIYRASDNSLVGLHHCGGCATPGVGNRGVRMTDIYPLIEPFVCTSTLSLSPAGASDLVEVAGNGNPVVEPGETWQFSAAVRNGSCADGATNVTASIGTSTTGVTVIDPSASFGNIAAATTAVAVNPTQFQLGSAVACGSDVVIDVLGIDSDGGSFAGAGGVLTAQVGDESLTLQFSEDFTAGFPGWMIIDGGSGQDFTWTNTNPGARSLPLAAPFMIVDSDWAGTAATLDEELISPPVDVSDFGSVTLQFAHDFNWYTGGLDEQADVDVRSSATNGAWVNLVNFSGGDASGTVSVDVTPYAAADLQVRFHYYNAQYEWWWAIDDVALVGSNGFVCEPFEASDSDADGVADFVDNCTLVANPDQRDTDGDGFGNLCDADLNNDCVVDLLDLAEFRSAFLLEGDLDEDLNGDAVVNLLDLAVVRNLFLDAPGPGLGLCPPPILDSRIENQGGMSLRVNRVSNAAR